MNNLDLARECGAKTDWHLAVRNDPELADDDLVFSPIQLDAFVERVRANDAVRIAELQAQLEAIGAGGASVPAVAQQKLARNMEIEVSRIIADASILYAGGTPVSFDGVARDVLQLALAVGDASD